MHAEPVALENPRSDPETPRLCGARIPEYWIADSLNHKILVHTLEGIKLRRVGTFGRGKVATSVLLTGFTVNVDDVFDAD